MNDLKYTLQKIESLAKQPPDEDIYKYLSGWIDKWQRENFWLNRIWGRLNRRQSLLRRPIYRAVLLTLAKMETKVTYEWLEQFYEPDASNTDRDNIKRAVISFFYKDYFEQPVDKIDFDNNDDFINIEFLTKNKAQVVFTKVLRKSMDFSFDVSLKKKKFWIIYEVTEKK